jgi:cold shock protein
MATGQVKWFNRVKGFGFITQGGQDDIFVHYSQIQDEEHDSLRQGDKVEFDLCQGPGGLHATNVQRLDGDKVVDRPRVDQR